MRHARSALPLLLALPVALAAGGCADAADRAAKERIFSPEEPAPAIARAREPLDAASAGTTAATWQRIWEMNRREVTERLGAHRATTEVKWRWTRPGRTVALVETHAFETEAAGDFHASITNDEEGGLEFVWADGEAFARSRYGQYRARRIDRAQHDVWRDQATSGPRTLAELFARRLRGTASGEVTYEKRKAVKYTLVLGEPLGDAPKEPDAVPVLFGVARGPDGTLSPGPDADTGRRIEFERRRTPERVAGEALVDVHTGALLKVDAKARFKVPGENGQDAALDVDLAYALVPDANVQIETPKEVVAPRMPHAVRDPLWFLGDDAPGAKENAEPADEDDGDATPAEAPAKKAPDKAAEPGKADPGSKR